MRFQVLWGAAWLVCLSLEVLNNIKMHAPPVDHKAKPDQGISNSSPDDLPPITAVPCTKQNEVSQILFKNGPSKHSLNVWQSRR